MVMRFGSLFWCRLEFDKVEVGFWMRVGFS